MVYNQNTQRVPLITWESLLLIADGLESKFHLQCALLQTRNVDWFLIDRGECSRVKSEGCPIHLHRKLGGGTDRGPKVSDRDPHTVRFEEMTVRKLHLISGT